MITILCPQCKVKVRIDEAQPETTVWTCPSCETKFKVPASLAQKAKAAQAQQQAQQKAPPKPKDGTVVVNSGGSMEIGWIVVHDKSTTPQTFPLKAGRNTIGRKADKPCDILIETQDKYMSRQHCVITVRPQANGTFLYSIADFGKEGDKLSTNGTFVNANPKRLEKMTEKHIQEGDTIQIGRTQIVLKTPDAASNAADARNQALDNDRCATIVL
jgi:pSer/pThr/pTyr-binding forkhead associated (FHA) protein